MPWKTADPNDPATWPPDDVEALVHIRGNYRESRAGRVFVATPFLHKGGHQYQDYRPYLFLSERSDRQNTYWPEFEPENRILNWMPWSEIGDPA